MKFRKISDIYFVGIGGIGMSGIAELLHNLNFNISGSDMSDNENVKRLRKLGINITIGHSKNNIKAEVDVMVYSSAIPKDNPELVYAKNRKIPTIRRAEMLGELISVKETSIAVGGTHGKTTTSSMVGTILSHAKMDPTLVVGCLLYTSPSPRDLSTSRMPSSA